VANRFHWLLALCVAGISLPATAQNSNVPGGFKHDRNAPIEITSESLEVRQAEQMVIFTGDVIAGQGQLRLTADEVVVLYDENSENQGEAGAIKKMTATGSVFLSSCSETAQGDWAEYDVDAALVNMRGSVVLTRSVNVITGDRATVNLTSGQGKVEGNVKSIFKPGSGDKLADKKPTREACADESSN
jgi:lipopolysaccharide export system protein LptA